jgi:hypothetical protein
MFFKLAYYAQVREARMAYLKQKCESKISRELYIPFHIAVVFRALWCTNACGFNSKS